MWFAALVKNRIVTSCLPVLFPLKVWSHASKEWSSIEILICGNAIDWIKIVRGGKKLQDILFKLSFDRGLLLRDRRR